MTAPGSLSDRQRKSLGEKGEDMAVAFLRKKGYKILIRNYRSRAGEIDIVARTGATICFVEVKTRRTRDFGAPQEAVTQGKQRTIALVALDFLQRHRLEHRQARFDVVAVDLSGGEARLEHIENAFELAG